MRHASSYRGARRNRARSTRALSGWRNVGYTESANAKADLGLRAAQANSAREAASKALVAAGALAGPAVVNYAFLEFYRAIPALKRTRVVNRIIKSLVKTLPPMRSRAA